MTLSLYVLRHAKAEEISRSGDRARALKRRGRKAAEVVGRALTRLSEVPQLVLSSDAVRTRETAELALAAGGWKAPLELRPGIYEAGSQRLLDELTTLTQSVQRVLLVGHQPGLGLLIAELTGHEPDFPIAALARIDLELDSWSELAPATGRLIWLAPPELLALPD